MQSALERLSAYVSGIDQQAREERAQRNAYDRGPAVACLAATLSLVFMEYAREGPILAWLYRVAPSLYVARFAMLFELAVWIGVRLVGFFVLPAVVIRFVLRERLGDHGLGVRGLASQLPGYALLCALVLPCVALASTRAEFAAYYPFYRLAGASWLDLAAWELLYALHFVALEFFFRGFLLTALRPRLGSQAVFVAVIPYCMIHFTKPLLEVLAAIPAGLVLGLLAMRARSIWGGALLHVLVAWAMDVFALARTTGLPARAWP